MNVKKIGNTVCITIEQDLLLASVWHDLDLWGLRITDPEAAIQSIMNEMLVEKEDGENAIHRMLRDVALEAIEQGEEGFDER